MGDIGSFIKDIGFPVFVAVYLLFRLDNRLTEILREVKKWNGKKS